MIDSEPIASTPKQAVSERWWHRLIRVLVHLSTAAILIIAGALNFSSAHHTVFIQAYEPGYAKDPGVEEDCTIQESIDYLYCAEKLEPSQYLQNYLKYYGDKQASDFWEVKTSPDPDFVLTGKTVREFVNKVRSGESSDIIVISALLKSNLKYKRRVVYPTKDLLMAAGLTALWGAGWWLLGMGLYKLILYIVHGHTRVQRAT